MRILNVSLLLLLGLSGCVADNQFPVLAVPEEAVLTLDKATIQGFTPGSHQYKETPLRRYKVMATAGSFQTDLKSKTPRNYEFYSSVQGAIVSSEEDE